MFWISCAETDRLRSFADIASQAIGWQLFRMKLIETMAAITALLMPIHAHAGSLEASPKIGEEYEISKSYETSQTTSDGSSSGSSNGRDTILERVIAVRETGLELEYDFPKDTKAEDRARDWQFPARVFKPKVGPMQLLNSVDMEKRVEAWLKAAKWTRAVCGRWIFTWNAFHIECDPQAVIKTIESFDLNSTDIRGGAPYQEIEALGPGQITKKADGPTGASYAVEMPIDPEAVRRSRAEADVTIGEITQKPVTLEAALRARTGEAISGTISVTFDTDSAGNVWRRTKMTKLETKMPGGLIKGETVSETVERSAVSGRSGQQKYSLQSTSSPNLR